MPDNHSNDSSIEYGEGDGTFQAVGGKDGLHALVTDFFHFMSTEAQFKRLYDMHPANTDLSIDKLYRFLTGWMGSDKLYSQKYGSIQLPRAHMHLDVIDADKKAWLDCMAMAMDKQGFKADLKDYLLMQLAVPAERIKQVSQARQAQS
jgi:hemoglobin